MWAFQNILCMWLSESFLVSLRLPSIIVHPYSRLLIFPSSAEEILLSNE